ncbi:BRO-N domain-containing protein [Acinetobacter higginsii]|uniref:BRO-N domain-containing protein n=1 Tax=Acinetobacter higginsii TaxID=70347 RepID=UPI001F4B80DA|nr:BRO family protein [Acinetobacter higginsii]MCH7381180.1 hypothetical protein [Acinetobacter higginsii]
MNALIFQSATLNPIRQKDDQVWVTATDLAEALGYSRPDKVTQIYNRHADEFTSCMTQVIDNSDNLNLRSRIFSLRGAHLVAIFSRTPVAKEFRKWVLDVIEKKESKPKKKIDLTAFVGKETHQAMQLKYHRMFRQYDDMIDRLRDQIDEMQRKCRRYDFKMQVGALDIQGVAIRFGTSVAKIKQILIDEQILEDRAPYVETNKTVLNLTKRGQKLEFIFLHSDIVDGDVQDVIKITEDGMQYLAGMLDRKLM